MRARTALAFPTRPRSRRMVRAGQPPPLPPRTWVTRRLLSHMDEAKAMTQRNRRMTLIIAFNYGGRAEIVDAVRKLVEDGTAAGRVDERAIRSRLYLPDVPDPDLVIRTSGEFRISNFLLWELAYSELVFT